MEPRYRFAFFVDDHISHFYAHAGIAARLLGAGHAVRFYSPGKWQGTIAAAGFDSVADTLLDPSIISDQAPPATRAGWRATVEIRAADICRGLPLLLGHYKPDLLIFDPFMLCFWPALRSLAPAVSLSTKPLLTTDPLVPPYTSALVPADTPLGRLRVWSACQRARIAYARYRLRCTINEWKTGHSHRSLTLAIAKASGLDWKKEWRTRPYALDLRFASVPELVVHAAELELPRLHALEGPGAYIGPCTDLPVITTPIDLPAGSRPFIFVSLGTVNLQHTDRLRKRYRAVLEAIADTKDWRAVIATSDEATTALLAGCNPCPERVFIKTWVGRGEYLAEADAVVNHGGSASVKEAILAGRPMLVLPHRVDQPGMAARVVFHGLGFMHRGADSNRIKFLIAQLLADAAYRHRVEAMRNIFKKYDDQQIAVSILENAAAGQSPRF